MAASKRGAVIRIDRQIEVLQRVATCSAAAMPKLEKPADLESYWIDVNSLEDDADEIYRALLGELLTPPETAPRGDSDRAEDQGGHGDARGGGGRLRDGVHHMMLEFGTATSSPR